MAEDFSWAPVITRLLRGEDLERHEAAACMREIMEGAATPAQIAGFVVALRAKGETSREVVGLVETMRAFAAKVEVEGEVLDTCGTGGDRTGTFNVSTAAAFVCAGAGVPVAKHGNRAASSRCGSADVLESLGVRIDLGPDQVAECIRATKMGFCFAPMFHPAMRHAGGPRRELGIPTIFNFLGPLTNPAGATRQLLGVSDPKMLSPMVGALDELGSVRVLAFHGAGGLDELSIAGPSEVVDLDRGSITRWTVDPQELGFAPAGTDELAGGSADENAALLRGVLDGEPGPRRDIVVLNAGAALVAAGAADSLADGCDAAANAIDSGDSAEVLTKLVEVSNGL